MSYQRVILVLAATIAATIPSTAGAQLVRSGSPDLSFTATGPAGLNIVGKTSELTISDATTTITVTVPLSTLSTGIDLRDRHMKEKYLETGKYPTAVLQVEKAKLKVPTPGTDIEGKLSLHGVTRTVRVHYSANGSSDKATVTGTVHVNMKEFGINVPSYLGVTVKPDVDVSVQFDATDG